MTFDGLRQYALLQRRAMALMANAFGLLALLLTVVGNYGTMSNVVYQRSREIGVRRAFEAQTREVIRLVGGRGLRPVWAGLVLGVSGAAWFSRLLTKALFGISPGDPLTNSAVAGVVLMAAAAALIVPVHRAVRVDPVTILRE